MLHTPFFFWETFSLKSFLVGLERQLFQIHKTQTMVERSESEQRLMGNRHKTFWGDSNIVKLDCDDDCTTLEI